MRTFKTTCAQGDIYIRRVTELPKNVVEEKPENGVHIVTHSEDGAHHTMTAERVKMYRIPDSIMDIFLEVTETTSLDHQRPHDTHESIQFEPGIYHVRRQREYVSESFRRVED